MSGSRDLPLLSVRVRREGQGPSDAEDITDRVLSLTYTDELQRADEVRVTLDNEGFWAWDSGITRRGNTLSLTWGWPDQSTTTEMLVVASSGGAETVEVTGVHPIMALNDEVKSRVFENVSISDVVTKVLEERGFSGRLFIEDSRMIHRHLTQAGQTDAQFVRSLARRLSYDFYTGADGLYFRGKDKARSEAPVREYIYFTDPAGGEVLDLRVESRMTDRPKGKVTMRGIDVETKKPFTVTATAETVKPAALAPVLEVVDRQTGITSTRQLAVAEETLPTTARTQAEAQRRADGRFRRLSEWQHELNITVIGDARLAAGKTIRVSGIGQVHSGVWLIHQARHVVGPGDYYVELTCRRAQRGNFADTKKDAKVAGQVNDKKPPADGKLKEVEVVDKRTGESHTEWRCS